MIGILNDFLLFSCMTAFAVGIVLVGVAIMVDPASIVEFRQDFDNYLVVVRVTPGKPSEPMEKS